MQSLSRSMVSYRGSMKEMRLHGNSPLILLLLLCSACLGIAQTAPKYTRDDFPTDFVFGAGTSSYQYEGGADEDGRSPCVWDAYSHAGKIPGNSTGDVAADGYHKYKEDVKLMSDTGLEAYRFSISWSRLLPNGTGAINPKGLKYYNNVVDELIKNRIQPHIVLYHLDLPQVIEDNGGWLNPKIIDDFREYADVCFRSFGDRVSHWTTINEPNVIGQASYDYGAFPPGRCSAPFGVQNCSAGNSTTEPYIAVHNVLLAHAAAVNLYRAKYQATQNGLIGLNVYSTWYSPFSNATADVEATERVMDFMLGWVINPLVFGDYPKIMKLNAGQRLPSFTKAETEQVKGSFDFIGLNHYMSVYVKDNSKGPISGLRDFTGDMFAAVTVRKNDTPTGQFIPTEILSDPPGLQKMLEYLKRKYGNPPIYIQENGYGLGVNDTLKDIERINYLSGYIGSMLNAIRDGSDVRGYFVWSFVDVLEYISGYFARYGLYYVDFEDDERRRQPKLSAKWYSNFLKKNNAHILKTSLQGGSHALQ